MMRVLHVIPTIALEHGGPSHGVRMMASACAARHHVEVVATSYGTPQGRQDPGRTWQYEEGGVVYRLLPQLRGSRWNFSVPITRWLFSRAVDYDVLHIHAPFSYPTLAACAAARHAKVPYVYRTMGTLDPWSLRHRAWKKWPYYQALEKPNLRAASAIHVTSDRAAGHRGARLRRARSSHGIRRRTAGSASALRTRPCGCCSSDACTRSRRCRCYSMPSRRYGRTAA